jgi:hypothetical protein
MGGGKMCDASPRRKISFVFGQGERNVDDCEGHAVAMLR